MGMIDRTGIRWRTLSAVGLAVVLFVSACGPDADERAEQEDLATQLVDSAHAAGVAPRLTVGMAESLYGTEAPAVCGAFDGELSTAARNVLFGNLRQGRRKTITDDAVTYGRLVVETYCPNQLADFDEAVSVLDPFESSAS
jgi:hypothetical protein